MENPHLKSLCVELLTLGPKTKAQVWEVSGPYAKESQVLILNELPERQEIVGTLKSTDRWHFCNLILPCSSMLLWKPLSNVLGSVEATHWVPSTPMPQLCITQPGWKRVLLTLETCCSCVPNSQARQESHSPSHHVTATVMHHKAKPGKSPHTSYGSQ